MGHAINSLLPLLVMGASPASVTALFMAWRDAVGAADEQADRLRKTLSDVAEEEEKLKKQLAGKTDYTLTDLDAIRQSLIKRISKLEAIQTELKGAVDAPAGVGDSMFNDAVPANATRRIKEMKAELALVKNAMAGEGGQEALHAAIAEAGKIKLGSYWLLRRYQNSKK
ncbi:MAG: hypothetical protein GY862_31745 [Gammaproteobacteria bacterium]|nr:hypothetical protein [Gammaproteobacteria bacterium]